MNLRRWLRPGLGVKRWLVVVFVGLLFLALALALLLRAVYRDVTIEGPLQGLVSAITLQWLPYEARGAILATLGVGLFVVGSWRLMRALVGVYRPVDADQPLVELIYHKRFLSRGPRIVAIGGGTGLSTLLRGLKEHTSNLTAIVTVADDGGSSGALRTVLGVPAVGDIRNCIVALADAEPLMGQLLQYRFPADPGRPSDAEPATIAGHAIGNLLIAAMTAIEDGDFEEGIRQVNRVLAVRGRVVPVSATPLTLHARLRDGTVIDGQSRIARTQGIERVWLTPEGVAATTDAVAAIAEADAIVLGPGSLFTSLLPALLVPAIADAVAVSPATRILVCNVATQPGETTGFDLADHVEVLERHTRPGIADVVLANNDFGARVSEGWRGEPVRLRWPPDGPEVPRLVLDGVVAPSNAHHHDPARLATSIVRVIEQTGGRRRARAARTA